MRTGNKDGPWKMFSPPKSVNVLVVVFNQFIYSKGTGTIQKNHDLASFQLILDIKTQLSQSIVSESKNISNIVIVVP